MQTWMRRRLPVGFQLHRIDEGPFRALEGEKADDQRKKCDRN